MNTLQIEFFTQEQLIDFCDWFRTEGFGLFMRSTSNGKNSDEISCIATDEVPHHEDEDFFDSMPLFELQ